MTPAVVIQTVAPLEPSRWVAVWGERWEQEAYFSDRALALAYAAAHRGRVVRMAALDPWPCAGESSQQSAK